MTDTIWSDALQAAALFAVDPATGGIALRALPGPVRDRYLAALRGLLPPSAPLRRLPLHAADDRLLGGLDLPATLQAGRPVAARGVLAEADGGVLLAAMAERMPPGTAARLAVALDTGEVTAERDGLALRQPAAFGVVALDEGIAEDEHPPAALTDRLAFPVDLTGLGLGDLCAAAHDAGHVSAGRRLLPEVIVPDAVTEALATVAASLGVASLRALLLAVRAARAAAALAGRREALEADAMAAARLVLAPRATVLPMPPGEAEAKPEEQQPADAAPEGGDDAPGEPQLGEILLQAARAAMPAGLLAQLAVGRPQKARAPAAGRAGALQAARRGRPIGERPGALRAGVRLNLVATLRAAAPWQRLRGAVAEGAPRVLVRPDDVRITRFRQRSETTTIFVVDASGSAALNRLAEAKGAVELVLADCYVRRDRVALIAFRGAGAELLLPPTSSLVRARRRLAALPGGGGTPLAAGLAAGFELADGVRRRGGSPILILLSDGRANIARDGTPGRPAAEADALAAGRALRAAAITCVVVDTSPRPAPQAKRLATEMGARYLPLPYADAEGVARAVRHA